MQNETLTQSQNQPKDDVYYGPSWYNLDKQELSEAKKLDASKPVWAAVWAWVCIAVLIKGYLFLWDHYSWAIYLYPVFALFIAGRGGVFLQLAHEAAHGLISPDKKFNDWFGHWMSTAPLGFDLRGYTEGHMRHHACTNQVSCDPASDIEKYKFVDISKPRMWGLFLKDITGFTALFVRLMYDQPNLNKYRRDIQEYLETEEGYTQVDADQLTMADKLKKYGSIALVQLVVLGALFKFNVFHYGFLWFLPLATAHMFLMRVRGVAEHGMGLQLGLTQAELEKKTRGMFFTRSFGTPANRYSIPGLNFIERCLIGSLDVYYHHEHHLFPKVPYYNLARVHRLVADKVKGFNPAVYAKGYFACLFFNFRHNQTVPHPKPNFP